MDASGPGRHSLRHLHPAQDEGVEIVCMIAYAVAHHELSFLPLVR